MHNFLEHVVFPGDVTYALDDVKLNKADELITSLGKAIDKFPEERLIGVEKWETSWPYLRLPEPPITDDLSDEEMEPVPADFRAGGELLKKDFKQAFIELYDNIAECYMRLEDGGVEPLACEKKALIILDELINLMQWPVDAPYVWPKVSTDDKPYTTWTPQSSAWDEAFSVDLIPTDIVWGDPPVDSE